jgi:hypothetical protein
MCIKNWILTDVVWVFDEPLGDKTSAIFNSDRHHNHNGQENDAR